jgi:MFS transporter, FHS family, glucose/mannose:H+ symporter
MYQRNRVFASACLGILLFGIVMTSLGAILPGVIERFGVGAAEAGSLLAIMSVGIVIGSVVFGPIVDRYGYKGLLIAGTVLVILGLEGLAFAPSFSWLRPAALLIGLGGGVINGGTNALVADISEDGRSAGLSYLGIFFGIGAFGVPFAMGSLQNALSPTAIIAVVGAMFVIPVVYFAAIRFPQPKLPQGVPLKAATKLTSDGVLIMMALLLFLQSGMEIAVGGWTATYFTEVIALEAGTAIYFLSLFWAGMMLARIILGSILKRRSPEVVFFVFIGIALTGALLLLASTELPLAASGIFLIGAGLAAGFPIVLGFVGDRYPHVSGTAFSLVLVIALAGGSVMPYLAGVLADASGLRLSFGLVPAALVGQAVLLALLIPRMKRPPKPVSSQEQLAAS